MRNYYYLTLAMIGVLLAWPLAAQEEGAPSPAETADMAGDTEVDENADESENSEVPETAEEAGNSEVPETADVTENDDSEEDDDTAAAADIAIDLDNPGSDGPEARSATCYTRFELAPCRSH